MFTIVKEKLPDTPAYMESPIWNVSIREGLSIESKPFTPFCITPNGDTIRFWGVSDEDVSATVTIREIVLPGLPAASGFAVYV